MKMEKNEDAEYMGRSKEGRRDPDTDDRRKGNDTAVNELFDNYEVTEERTNADRRDGEDQRTS